MRDRLRLRPMVAALILLGACTPSISPSPSVQPSASPTETAVNGLPPGCEPIELRGPNGERIELDGEWVEVVEAGEPMTWWIRTQGDCVWGNGQVEDVETQDPFFRQPGQVQSLSGVIGSDFMITGEILFLGPLPAALTRSLTPYSPLRMLIAFDDAGEITLREDREPMVRGPRCPDPVSYCPAPLVLRPAD